MTELPARPPRLRDTGHHTGRLTPGPRNTFTDVPSVRTGHTTLHDDRAGIHTGVTAIVPEALLNGARAVPAGLSVANGYGKLVGATQLAELGELETPVLLTSTLSTFRAADALVGWLLDRATEPLTSVNPVVGEINDSWLSTADPRPITPEHVHAALDGASGAPVPLGNVGGGAGACALGFKAGLGSASRLVPVPDRGEVPLGVLVQANMGGDLRVGGTTLTPEGLGLPRAGAAADAGSCVVVIAVGTACPGGQLARIAARGGYALGRVGAAYAHGSGDYGLAFATEPSTAPAVLSPAGLDALFAAVLEAVEEAVVDALLAAHTVRSPTGRVAHALPHGALPHGAPAVAG